MEILVFALIATTKGYVQHETFVSEGKFLTFDLRPLRRPYNPEDNSPSRPSVRKKWVMVEVAS